MENKKKAECTSCNKSITSSNWSRHIKTKQHISYDSQVCLKSNVSKSKIYFHKDKQNVSGLKSYSKECQNKYKTENIECEVFSIVTTRNYYYRHLKSKKLISLIPSRIAESIMHDLKICSN